MKLNNLFAKHMMVAEDLRLPVSRHFFYSTFAVQGRYDGHSHLGAFVVDGFPGTGFFIRNSESHSYRRFIAAIRKQSQQNIFSLLFGREPSFDKENARIEEAYAHVKNDDERRILSHYQNVVGLAKEEELLQRIVRSVKDKNKKSPQKSLVSVLSHYKSSIAGLERDVRSAQLNYNQILSDEQKAEWAKVVEAFHLLVDSRRIWSVYVDKGTASYEQVFFDMGVFDYIKVPGETPVMRDHNGIHYYLLPDGFVVARSTVDFDFYKLNEVDFEFSVVDISTLAVRPQFNSRKHHGKKGHKTDALSTLYGTTRAQVVGEINIPTFDKRFYVNHTGPAEDFVNAMKNYVNWLAENEVGEK